MQRQLCRKALTVIFLKSRANTLWEYWGLAIISIILISWGFYYFVAPKTWKEWTRAGFVQAFIIFFVCRDVRLPFNHIFH